MRLAQCRLILLSGHFAVQLQRDERRKSLEHTDDLRVGYFGGCRIDGAQIAEISPIRQSDGHRHVTFYFVDLGRVMIAVARVRARLLDEDTLVGSLGFNAKRGLQSQLLPRL